MSGIPTRASLEMSATDQTSYYRALLLRLIQEGWNPIPSGDCSFLYLKKGESYNPPITDEEAMHLGLNGVAIYAFLLKDGEI